MTGVQFDAIHALLIAPFVVTGIVLIVCAVAAAWWADR